MREREREKGRDTGKRSRTLQREGENWGEEFLKIDARSLLLLQLALVLVNGSSRSVQV